VHVLDRLESVLNPSGETMGWFSSDPSYIAPNASNDHLPPLNDANQMEVTTEGGTLVLPVEFVPNFSIFTVAVPQCS
jgi:hypothetical protein